MIPDTILGLLEPASVGAYVMSYDQTILFWNREAERILGFRAEEVIGRRCYEVVAGLAAGGITPACLHGCPSMRDIRVGDMPRAITMRMLCASGERKVAYLTPMAVAAVEDQAPLLVHVFDDAPDTAAFVRIADGVRRELMEGGAGGPSDRRLPGSDLAANRRLSPRELEVLHLVSLGTSTLRMAEELGISPHTVRNHVRNLREKLGADSKLAAVLTALRLGILEWK